MLHKNKVSFVMEDILFSFFFFIQTKSFLFWWSALLHFYFYFFYLQSEGKTQQEAMYINKSLTFLEQVIVALADRRRDHIPFRQSKLTHCLKDSIGGRSNTLLVANIWGETNQIEETVSV